MKKYTFILLLVLPICLYAVDKNPSEFSDIEKEQRYQEMTNELRCVVCQNQSVADSNAELAQDVRNLVRNKINQGETNQQITDFLVERYGDFVLYDPPLKPKTYVLWIGPLILILVAFMALLYFIRRHANMTADSSTLTDEERNKIKKALDE
ncbi:cytochrome c-type biogenesis protein [Candidatus Parabeggiatoa sp. HSG14]|uniref:cytochrome c-type biogenesis protein n=1 Tax=Candidatus Parabeggiatoa sp. HSG14 TaxID=3055593 RepID=UPI0025A6FC84|nr:cytochrome c-type biogenesis protein CcmH [Thiotrichales bacterium HSG14]